MIAVGEAELLFSCLKTLLMYKVSINQSVNLGRGAGKGAEGTAGGPAHGAGNPGPYLSTPSDSLVSPNFLSSSGESIGFPHSKWRSLAFFRLYTLLRAQEIRPRPRTKAAQLPPCLGTVWARPLVYPGNASTLSWRRSE